MKMSLFINGAEDLRIENNKYYVVNEDTDWDYMKEVSRNDFIQALKRYSWVCLTTWSKDLREEYLKLVDYCKELGE